MFKTSGHPCAERLANQTTKATNHPPFEEVRSDFPSKRSPLWIATRKKKKKKKKKVVYAQVNQTKQLVGPSEPPDPGLCSRTNTGAHVLAHTHTRGPGYHHLDASRVCCRSASKSTPFAQVRFKMDDTFRLLLLLHVLLPPVEWRGRQKHVKQVIGDHCGSWLEGGLY